MSSNKDTQPLLTVAERKETLQTELLRKRGGLRGVSLHVKLEGGWNSQRRRLSVLRGMEQERKVWETEEERNGRVRARTQNVMEMTVGLRAEEEFSVNTLYTEW